ncbi:hypothetical protein ACW9HJ_33685 [Nocardia gipuzkoensis]
MEQVIRRTSRRCAHTFFRVESPTDIPEPALREVENTVTDWIDTTYNDASDEIVEVQWGSYAGTRLVN